MTTRLGPSRPWSDDELDVLCLNYWALGTPGCARKLRRSRSSCKWMASKLGLRTCVRSHPTTQMRMDRWRRTLPLRWAL